MTQLRDIFCAYTSDESGATAIEYALIATLIAVGIITGASAVSGSINEMFTNVDSDVGQAFSD